MNSEELAEALRHLHAEKNAELERRFDRNLSFADGLFDRWERAAHLGFEEGASIYDSALVFGKVTVEANTWIGPYTLLDGSGGGIAIGRWCSISSGVQIYTHDTVHRVLSGGLLPRREGAVSIGDCSYIGSQSIIAWARASGLSVLWRRTASSTAMRPIVPSSAATRHGGWGASRAKAPMFGSSMNPARSTSGGSNVALQLQIGIWPPVRDKKVGSAAFHASPCLTP